MIQTDATDDEEQETLNTTRDQPAIVLPRSAVVRRGNQLADERGNLPSRGRTPSPAMSKRRLLTNFDSPRTLALLMLELSRSPSEQVTLEKRSAIYRR